MAQLTKMRLFATFALVALSGTAAARAADRVDFNRDIRPILSESCYQCHGPDHNKRKADLRLDTRAGLFRKTADSTIVVPGKPGASELFVRITATDDETKMPPPARAAHPLTTRQVDLIRRWIDEGAEWKGHWAYLAPERPAVPTLAPAAPTAPGAADSVDRFIRHRLKEVPLEPSPEADRITLIRRLNFDLTGLPPAPEEVEAFVADRRANAYEEVVDRLLASPHFGERMAIFWLDLVRFADTTGYHGDNHVDLYLYRDYVIRSFNNNKPFDRFTIEQLAGDLLPDATDETRIASGYNRLLQTTQEGGAQAKEYIAKYAADRVRNLSTVWLGATLGCAECHDHKYDPFSTRDFYNLEAFFADIEETPVGVQQPTPFPSALEARQRKSLQDDIARLKAKKNPGDGDQKELAALEGRLRALEKRIPTSLVSHSIAPRIVRVLPRGNWLDESGPVVQPSVPATLPGLKAVDQRPSRLDLARWLVSSDNPLVARVIVNRFWKLAFGQGLVTTADDFGSQGTWPTHPDLLDWLAREFIDSGWDVKATLKLIVMSETYRQSSTPRDSDRQRDPANRWLSRQNRFRLDAELVRDNALAISGLLSNEIGGPSVKPYQPPGYWIFLNFPMRDYAPDHGENQYRRGLYTYWQRTFLHPSLLAFDASTREECVVERARSNTPLQSLVLLNDPTYVEAARAFAGRVIRAVPSSDPARRLELAFRLAVSRSPRPREVAVMTDLLKKHMHQYQSDPTAASEILGVGEAPNRADASPAELAAWTSVARVLLNLHETISRN